MLSMIKVIRNSLKITDFYTRAKTFWRHLSQEKFSPPLQTRRSLFFFPLNAFLNAYIYYVWFLPVCLIMLWLDDSFGLVMSPKVFNLYSVCLAKNNFWRQQRHLSTNCRFIRRLHAICLYLPNKNRIAMASHGSEQGKITPTNLVWIL